METRVIKKGIEKGELNKLDSGQLASIIWRIIIGIVRQSKIITTLTR
jgi:hypothetical protein